MSMSTLGWIIFALIVTVVIMFFFKDTIVSGNEIANKEICKSSIQMSSNKLKEEIEGLFDPYGNAAQIECSTEYINYDEDDPEVVKRIIANKMYDCWDMYLEGEKELFETKDGAYCAVCSRLTFEEDVKINQFMLFLRETKIPTREDTYWEYFYGTDIESFETDHYLNSEFESYDRFTTSDPLAVIFFMDKDAYPGAWKWVYQTKKVETLKMGGAGIAAGTVVGLVTCGLTAPVCGATFVILGLGAGAGSGYMIGADKSAEYNAYVYLGDYDNLNSLGCTRLEAKSTPLQVMQK